MLLVAVTGSLGAGKSKVAIEIASKTNMPLFDADKVVHQLYRPGGKAVGPVARRFPDVLDSEGGIDRKKLSGILTTDPDRFKDLNDIVHPLVGEVRREFLERHKVSGVWMVVLDIPLLFEGGKTGKSGADIVIVVDAQEKIRRERLRKRSNMSDEKFDMLESKQLPVKDKCSRADYVIYNDGDWSMAQKNISDMLKEPVFQNGRPLKQEV